MTTMLVKDATGADVTIEKPLAPGRSAAADSRPVALSTEDKASIDAITTKLSSDPATQTTLAAILAKIISAPATAANQTTEIAALATIAGHVDGIETLIGATNTALTTIDGRVDGVETLIGTTNTKLSAGATTIAKAEDVASADADVGVPAMAVRKATPANTSGTDGDYEMLQMSAGRLWVSAILEAGAALLGRAVADASAATGGIATTARMASAAASTNATNVKTSAGRIYQVSGKNNATYDIFLVLYDAVTNPPVPGTTTIRKKIVCPAGVAFVYDFPVGLTFASGIGYAFTKLVADADTTVLVAADITAFNMDYV
jgi:hypothetical protein